MFVLKFLLSKLFKEGGPKYNQQQQRAVSLDRREVNSPYEEVKFHRKNVFHNDLYEKKSTNNNYNPVTGQVRGANAGPSYGGEEHNPYSTMNRDYGKGNSGVGVGVGVGGGLDKLAGKRQCDRPGEFNIISNEGGAEGILSSMGKRQYNEKTKNDFNLINGQFNYNPEENMGYPVSLAGKKQFDHGKANEFNIINNEGSGLNSRNAGKRQYNEKGKNEFNVISGPYQGGQEEGYGAKDFGKKKFVEKGKNEFNLISGQKNEEGKYFSAKQEYNNLGENRTADYLKKRLMENSNLVDKFAGRPMMGNLNPNGNNHM